jgi:hypothetical protein
MSLNSRMKWDVRAIVEEMIRAALAPVLARLGALEGKPDAEQAAAFAEGAGVDLSDDPACPTCDGVTDDADEPDDEPVPPKRARKAAK